MKLQELAAISPTKQAAKVFESYFGNSVKFDSITPAQATKLLSRVRSLVSEHRRTPAFHKSEQDPSYLKLVMLEQALSARVNEDDAMGGATLAIGQSSNTPGAQQDAQKQRALLSAQQQQKKRQIQDLIKAKQKEIQDLQQQMNNPVMATMESRSRLSESEVQQAQVVLASQDMVDQVQKMLEQVSAMQFKDLPALVDQVKNQIGVDQAMQFNTDASAALTGMIQNLQASKGQLEQALGVVTGQAATIPGEELSTPAPGADEVDVDAELPAPDGGEEDIDAEFDANLETPKSSLGRARR